MNRADLLIRNVTIFEPASPLHLQTADLLLQDDFITINPEITETTVIVDGSGKYISSGWTDLRVHSGEPGFEHKETISSVIRAAAAGGIARIGIFPNLHPVTDHRVQIQFIQSVARELGSNVLPFGAVSVGLEGSEMAELYDMYVSGAVAFTDADRPIQKTGLLLRALRYTQPFGARIWVRAEDSGMAAGGKMHEGVVSVSLGLKGVPAVAESMAVARDLEILRYAGGKLHFSKVSTAAAVALIRDAKSEGLDITADVCIHHLILTDATLSSFDALYKMVPPLRDEWHRNALREGLEDGTIDAVVSDHCPENIEHKNLEFDDAAPGVIGTQIMYSLYETYLSSEISRAAFIRALTSGPAACARMDYLPVQSGKRMPLTLFDPQARWKFDQYSNLSLSANSPFLGSELSGVAEVIV